jgi:hypothetical protein
MAWPNLRLGSLELHRIDLLLSSLAIKEDTVLCVPRDYKPSLVNLSVCDHKFISSDS